MEDKNKIPSLKIVFTNRLILHESYDENRVKTISNMILKKKIFTNPILCVRQAPKSNKYVVLDGANRTTALRQLGLGFALVQEFNYKDLKF